MSLDAVLATVDELIDCVLTGREVSLLNDAEIVSASRGVYSAQFFASVILCWILDSDFDEAKQNCYSKMAWLPLFVAAVNASPRLAAFLTTDERGLRLANGFSEADFQRLQNHVGPRYKRDIRVNIY